MAKNPFKVLGLDPAILHGLPDSQVLRLAETMYRALMQIHHQDVGGKGSASRCINEAIEKIRNQDLFLHWKTEHLRRRKDQVSELENDLDQERAEHDELIHGLLNTIINYALAFSRVMLVAGPCRILISNVLKAKLQAFSSAIPNKEKGEVFELTIDKNGSLFRRRAEKIGFDARTEKAPSLPKGWVYTSGLPQNGYYWNPFGEPRKITSMNLVGSIALGEIQHSGEISPFSQLIRSNDQGINEQDILESETGFPLINFLPYIPFLDPRVGLGRYLIGLSGACAEDGRAIVLGRIMAIHPSETFT